MSKAVLSIEKRGKAWKDQDRRNSSQKDEIAKNWMVLFWITEGSVLDSGGSNFPRTNRV
jgi:hypothetical protein